MTIKYLLLCPDFLSNICSLCQWPQSFPVFLHLFHGWKIVICNRRVGGLSSSSYLARGSPANHITEKACLNIAIITAIISCCLPLALPSLHIFLSLSFFPLEYFLFLSPVNPDSWCGLGADSCMTRNVSLCKSPLPPCAVLA